jgi:hypothetical protein
MPPSLVTQTIVAFICDFDVTLTRGYMQKPLFEHYGVDEDKFRADVKALTDPASSETRCRRARRTSTVCVPSAMHSAIKSTTAQSTSPSSPSRSAARRQSSTKASPVRSSVVGMP